MMNQKQVTALRAKQTRRLRDFGHPVTWQKNGRAHLGTCRACGAQIECDEYGVHFLGGILNASFLKFPGVNFIRRCPGAR